MKKWHFKYHTNCVNSTARRINDMTDQARDITWNTFRQYVHWTEVQQVFPSYSYRKELYNPHTEELTCAFHIKDDWAVTFHKSQYRGEPCYYIQHSSIEYIFLKR